MAFNFSLWFIPKIKTASKSNHDSCYLGVSIFFNIQSGEEHACIIEFFELYGFQFLVKFIDICKVFNMVWISRTI